MGRPRGPEGWCKHPVGHHMALCVVAIELRGGWQARRCPGTTVSEVSGLAGALGRLLALVEGATAGGAGLDSTRPMFRVPAQPCTAA